MSVSAISVSVGNNAANRNLSGQSWFNDVKAVFTKSPSLPLAFPEHYVVSCECKDVAHDPHSGCGHEGVVETAELP